jgi:GNAT superfamily N-acetyltransferase
MFDGRNSLTIATEYLETFLKDGRSLYGQHIEAHRKQSGLPSDTDIGLARKLESIGALLIITARSCGEMVGYITFIIAPDLETAGRVFAEQKIFFVRPDYRGIGLKLRAAAKRELKSRGVHGILALSSKRLSGPKFRYLLRREGAELRGELYYQTL